LERELGVTYKTAWRMFTLIRNELMTQDDDQLSGSVEVDETYVGGKPRLADKAQFAKAPNTRQAAQKWSDKKKVPVLGMVERGGRVRAQVVPSTQRPTLIPRVVQSVAKDSIVYTDDARVYKRTLPKAGYNHQVISHTTGVYVSGDIHTQTIEGFWSLVKRGISGTHHAVSPKWLQGYLNEYVWRYNHRDDPRAMFALLLLRAANPRVTDLAG
jgi:transposase-like protein